VPAAPKGAARCTILGCVTPPCSKCTSGLCGGSFHMALSFKRHSQVIFTGMPLQNHSEQMSRAAEYT
jgi:hypothetical protein